jgi:hypothetical protein
MYIGTLHPFDFRLFGMIHTALSQKIDSGGASAQLRAHAVGGGRYERALRVQRAGAGARSGAAAQE